MWILSSKSAVFSVLESQLLENMRVPGGSALPPDPEETEAFADDSSPDAFSLLLGTFSCFVVYYENHPFSSVYLQRGLTLGCGYSPLHMTPR